MSLFNFGKNKDESLKTKSNCTVGTGNVESSKDKECGNIITDISDSVKVLGSGCKVCHQQYENVKKTVDDLGIKINVEYITDMDIVMKYGVMSMPAIVVNEKVVSMGKVLKPLDVEELLKSIFRN